MKSLKNKLLLAVVLTLLLGCSKEVKKFTFVPFPSQAGQNPSNKVTRKVGEGLLFDLVFLDKSDWDAYFSKLGPEAVAYADFLKKIPETKVFFLFEIEIRNQTKYQVLFNPVNAFIQSNAGKWPAYNLSDLMMEDGFAIPPINQFKDYFFDSEIYLQPGEKKKRALLFKWPFEEYSDLTLTLHDIYINGKSYDLKQPYTKTEIPDNDK